MTPRRSSYEKINYALRPAKNIERKMLCEAFQKLNHLEPIANYKYIGFGSTFFSDFSLFHRVLNISDLISIEKDKVNSERFDFNKPYDCIKLKFGDSCKVLSNIPLNKKTILWLDYDQKLANSMLTDIEIFCSKAQAGSVLVISANVHPANFNEIDEIERGRSDNQTLRKRYLQLKGRLENKSIPAGTNEKSLKGHGLSKITHKVIGNKIEAELNKRNGGLGEDAKLKYQQLFNFIYSDGAWMLSTGGIIFSENQKDLIKKCTFNDLSFIREKDNPYKIEVPSLTLKEIKKLNEYLPNENLKAIKEFSLPEGEIDKYQKIYRYFPSFTEADM